MPERWPTKPRAGDLCEASLGWEPDSFGQPRVVRCGIQAVETVMVSDGLRIPAYVCAAHAPAVGVRNPKRAVAERRGQ